MNYHNIFWTYVSEQNGIDIQEVSKERGHQNVNDIGYESILKHLDEKETQIHSVCIIIYIIYFCIHIIFKLIQMCYIKFTLVRTSS